MFIVNVKLNLLNKQLKEVKRSKSRKILRISQPSFQHYVKETETQVKKVVSLQKR